MSSELIFLTGSSGFLGSSMAIEAVKRGYRLRLCLRKPSEKLSTLLAPYHDQVEYVFIQNFADKTAWKGHLDGANYVIHMASPVPQGTDKEYYFSAAVGITTALLQEATRVPTIKKVVVTSSLAALTPLDDVPPGGIVKEDNHTWNLDVDEAADFTVPNDPIATAMFLYRASKLLARKVVWDFCRNENPPYSLVVLYPGFVFGRNPIQSSPEAVMQSSNGGFWHAIMEGAQPESLNCVHISDVVEAHIKALNPKVLHGSAYVLAPNKVTWKEVADIVHRDYPDSGAKINRENGETIIPSMQVDCTKAEVELGMDWRSMEEMVHDVMDQQLELRRSANV